MHMRPPLRPGHVLVLLTLVAVALAAAIVPYAFMRYHAGDAWRGVTPQLSHDAIRYFARTNDVVLRGNFYPHNPYLIEHKDEASPTPSVNDALVGIPQLLGISFNGAYYANIVLWGLLFLLLAYALFRDLGGGVILALVGAVWVYVGEYGDMLRPGAMQIVYPHYLAFLLVLAKTLRSGGREYHLALAFLTGLSAYSYIFLFMTTLATLGVVALHFAWQRAWRRAIEMIGTICLSMLVAAPHFLYVFLLSGHQHYAETMERIIFVATHWPQIESYYYGRWVIIGLATLFLAGREISRRYGGLAAPFLIAVGAGAFIAMQSNIVMGKDFDIAVHVARFSILWMLLLVALLLPAAWNLVRSWRPLLWRLALLGCFALLTLQSFANLGRNVSLFTAYPKEEVVTVQSFKGVLDALSRLPASVVHAEGEINAYIPMLTSHYTLFDTNALLFLASDAELRERYLLAHAFDGLSRDEFIARHNDYHGPSPSRLAAVSKMKYELCAALFARESCGAPVPELSFVDTTSLGRDYDAYYPGLPARIEKEYARYSVRYLVLPTEKEAPMEIARICAEIYRDDRFVVCELPAARSSAE